MMTLRFSSPENAKLARQLLAEIDRQQRQQTPVQRPAKAPAAKPKAK